MRKTKNLLKEWNKVRPRPRSASEGDPDALDIPTPRSYAEAIEGPYSSQWQAAMDAEMASWKSTGTYVDAVPPPRANIVSGMWIFRVKRPPGSPPVFKARYVARGFKFGDEAERPRWAELLGSGVAILDLDYDVILAAMYALTNSTEGDCYLCVPPNPGIEVAALGASESVLPGTAPTEALHIFTLDSGASCYFFRDSTTLTPLSAPVPIRLADPSRGPVLARSSTVLLCPAVPSGSLLGLHLPSFSTNLVSTAALQDAMVTTTTPGVRLHLRERFRQDLPFLRLNSDRGVMEVARTSMIHAAAPHFLWPFAVSYAAHQLNHWPRVSLPKTLPTPRWTGKVGDASVFRIWGSRAFVRDASADKLSARAILCVYLGISPDAPGWQFCHPTSCRVFPSEDVTVDESVPFYRLFPYCSAPPSPPTLFLAPGPPPLHPLPPKGPAPSGVSQVDPLPGTVRVEVAVGSGFARGAASRGAASGGAEPEGAESEGAGSGGAEPAGAEPAGVEPGGAEPAGAESGGVEPEGAARGAASGGAASWGAEPGGAESEGAETGGTEPGGVETGSAEPEGVEPGGAASEGAESGGAEPQGATSSGGFTGASPRLSLQQLREWFVRRAQLRSGATGAGGAGAAGAGGAGVVAGAGVTGEQGFDSCGSRQMGTLCGVDWKEAKGGYASGVRVHVHGARA
ncbi:unnamed protein product [Closterium sp. NIES-54]